MAIIRDGSGVFEVLHSGEKANFVTKVIYGPIIDHTLVFIINILFHLSVPDKGCIRR